MSKYSSDSNSRDRSRSYNRYYNQRQRSSSSSSTETSRHSKKYSSRTNSRYHKKSRRRHRSNSSSDCLSSRYKNSSRSYKKNEHRLKKKHRISSSSNESDNSNSSRKNNQPKVSDLKEKNKVSKPNSTIQAGNSKDNIDNLVDKNVYDVIKRENSIELIKQEGFVFKIFKPSIEQREDNINNYENANLHEDIINSLSVEKSTFLISGRERLLNVRYKLLTKKERSDIWAKCLFSSYKQQSVDG